MGEVEGDGELLRQYRLLTGEGTGEWGGVKPKICTFDAHDVDRYCHLDFCISVFPKSIDREI